MQFHAIINTNAAPQQARSHLINMDFLRQQVDLDSYYDTMAVTTECEMKAWDSTVMKAQSQEMPKEVPVRLESPTPATADTSCDVSPSGELDEYYKLMKSTEQCTWSGVTRG